MPEALVEARTDKQVGRLILNRPSALNALTLPMVQQMQAALNEWRPRRLNAVVIQSSSPKAFCAGGDIRSVRKNTMSGNTAANETFFETEYRLNYTLATYPHPVVALVDGICMGGGLGLSVHGNYRVVTDRAVLAMPETAIGFFPDVGASHFLSRLPGSLGMYLGLTGARIGAADALYSGLATHFLRREDLERLVSALAGPGSVPVEETLRLLSMPAPGDTVLSQHRDDIDWCFGAPELEQVRVRLERTGGPWSAEQLEVLDRVSQRSLQVTFDLIVRGRERDLAACLRADLDEARDITRTPDFLEGVRAALVDKDHRPRFSRAPRDRAPARPPQTAGVGG